MDVGDTVYLHEKYICENCSEEIAIQLIRR